MDGGVIAAAPSSGTVDRVLLPSSDPAAEFFANLMLERKWELAVGVAGRTLIEECGDRPGVLLPGLWRCSLDDVDEALL